MKAELFHKYIVNSLTLHQDKAGINKMNQTVIINQNNVMINMNWIRTSSAHMSQVFQTHSFHYTGRFKIFSA